jgi:hypothetical protein
MEYGTNRLAGASILGAQMQAAYGEQTAEVARNSQIQSASISLEAKIDDVLNRVQALEKRLYPILRPSAPSATEQNMKNPVQPVPLAETLHSFGNRLDSCSAQLGSILDRIEL